MPSSRIDWDRPANRWSIERDRSVRDGRRVHDLTVSNPVAAGLGPSRDRILDALCRDDVASYRPDPRGERCARDAIASAYASRGCVVDPSAIVLTPGTSEAYSYLFKMLADPGDAILVPKPSYPLFEFLAALEGVRVRTYPLRYDGGWHVDVAAVRQALRDGGVRALVAVHPNNPTGSFWRREEVDAVVDACRDAEAALIADEVFAAFPLRPDRDRYATFAGEGRVPTYVLDGLSKSVALPQVKLGWIVVAGPGSERERACARLDWILDTYLPVSVPIQLAVPDLLALGPAVRDRILQRLGRNLRALRGRVSGTAAGALDVEGGWSAVVRVPAVRSSEDRALDLLRRDGVLVQPGFFYDLDEEAHLVVSLLTPEEAFDRGIEAIVRDAERGL